MENNRPLGNQTFFFFSRQVKESNAEAEIAPCHIRVINLQAFVYVIPVHVRHIQEQRNIILPEKKSVQKLIFCSSTWQYLCNSEQHTFLFILFKPTHALFLKHIHI